MVLLKVNKSICDPHYLLYVMLSNFVKKQYKTVEAIYDNILLIPNKGKLQQKLVENKERVMLNKELVTIICDLQLEDPKIMVDADAFCGVLDYLEDTLNAQDLANQMGLLLQFIKESEV